VLTQQADAGAPKSRHRGAIALSGAYRAPGTDLEAQLAALWQKRLNVEPVGVDDDFFELGGHSLLAAELLVEVYEQTGVQVSATTLFLDPTIADLAQAIERGQTIAEEASPCDSPR
jgi:acyl carrier protein